MHPEPAPRTSVDPAMRTFVDDETLLKSQQEEAWERTDRLLKFRRLEGADEAPPGEPARVRWLAQNDVHTEFLDAGIGCCWFAYRDDEEPVVGETEDEAIARLARECGLDLWSRPAS